MKKVIEPFDILIRHTLNVELNLYETYETHFTRENFLEIKKNVALRIAMSLFRPGEAGYPLRDGQEGGHQDHQQGQIDEFSAAKSGERDRNHEID